MGGAGSAQRYEIRNSSPNAASQQQFADPVEWKDPSCAQQTTTLETRGNVESGGLIRDAYGDLQKSPGGQEYYQLWVWLDFVSLLGSTYELYTCLPRAYCEGIPPCVAYHRGVSDLSGH